MYIQRNEAATSLQCARQCKRTTGCVSVFYSHDDRNCQLHSIAIDIDGYTGATENVQSGEYLLLSQGSGGNMGLVVRNRSSGFPTRSDTYRAVQPQKMARSLNFRI